MSKLFIVGRRGDAYRSALRLGHEVFLWSSQPLHESRRKKLGGWIEIPFEDCTSGVPEAVVEHARSFGPDRIIATTEASVALAAQLREALSLPGTSNRISNIAHNKFAMKEMARSHGVPITDYRLISSTDTAQDLVEQLGLPLVVKPVDESGATGVKVLRSAGEVERNLVPGQLAEAFVEGKEVSVETFIHNGKAIFHNITDYLHQWQKSVLPAQLDPSLESTIIAINDRVIDAFEIGHGMTHAEFYLSPIGPVFGEIAIRPPGGYYMDLIQRAYQFDPWELYIALQCDEPLPSYLKKAKRFAAVYIVSPPPGRVTAISGLEDVQALDGIFEFRFKLTVGDVVAPRENTSNESGHILVHAGTKEDLLEKISFIEQTLKIETE